MGNDDCAGLPQGTHALAGAWSSGRGDTLRCSSGRAANIGHLSPSDCGPFYPLRATAQVGGPHGRGDGRPGNGTLRPDSMARIGATVMAGSPCNARRCQAPWRHSRWWRREAL